MYTTRQNDPTRLRDKKIPSHHPEFKFESMLRCGGGVRGFFLLRVHFYCAYVSYTSLLKHAHHTPHTTQHPHSHSHSHSHHIHTYTHKYSVQVFGHIHSNPNTPHKTKQNKTKTKTLCNVRLSKIMVYNANKKEKRLSLVVLL